MRVAHQGIAPSPLPGLENGGWFATNPPVALQPPAPVAANRYGQPSYPPSAPSYQNGYQPGYQQSYQQSYPPGYQQNAQNNRDSDGPFELLEKLFGR